MKNPAETWGFRFAFVASILGCIALGLMAVEIVGRLFTGEWSDFSFLIFLKPLILPAVLFVISLGLLMLPSDEEI